METLVISLGGSMIVPDKPDHFFLSEFKNFVLRYLDRYRFIIVCGGGKTNSYYNYTASRVSKVSKDDLDWIGIMASRLNAELIRAIFGKLASRVITEPSEEIDNRPIIIGAGWKPCRITDYIAVLLAERFKAKKVINLTNISYVYDKDPARFSDAVKFHNISWSEYRKIIGNRWEPRRSTPFDPIASRYAQKIKLTVAILNGKNLNNVKDFMENKEFKGTIISG